jgi:hypothetical protein
MFERTTAAGGGSVDHAVSFSGRRRTFQRGRFGAISEQFCGKPLRLGNSFHFNRDSVDGLLELHELEILSITDLRRVGLLLNTANESNKDRGARCGQNDDDERNLSETGYTGIHNFLDSRSECSSGLLPYVLIAAGFPQPESCEAKDSFREECGS